MLAVTSEEKYLSRDGSRDKELLTLKETRLPDRNPESQRDGRDI